MIIKEESYENITLPPIVSMAKAKFEEIHRMPFDNSLDFYNWLALVGAQKLIDETDDKQLKYLLTKLIAEYSNEDI